MLIRSIVLQQWEATNVAKMKRIRIARVRNIVANHMPPAPPPMGIPVRRANVYRITHATTLATVFRCTIVIHHRRCHNVRIPRNSARLPADSKLTPNVPSSLIHSLTQLSFYFQLTNAVPTKSTQPAPVKCIATTWMPFAKRNTRPIARRVNANSTMHETNWEIVFRFMNVLMIPGECCCVFHSRNFRIK